MKQADANFAARLGKWFRENRTHVFSSIDFRIGGACFVLVLVSALASAELRAQGPRILLAEAAVGIALLGVSLTALSILVGLADEHYLHVLERADDEGRLEPAFQPYRVVATVAAIAAVFSLMAAACWSVRIDPLAQASWILRSSALAVGSGLAIWCVIGVVQLVDLTAFHGAQRGYLMRGVRQARRQASEKKQTG